VTELSTDHSIAISILKHALLFLIVLGHLADHYSEHISSGSIGTLLSYTMHQAVEP
jgi:hypothetical protein